MPMYEVCAKGNSYIVKCRFQADNVTKAIKVFDGWLKTQKPPRDNRSRYEVREIKLGLS